MDRRISSTMILVILSSKMCSPTIVHGAKASTTSLTVDVDQTIYVRVDGTVDPSTAPIQRNGDIYTLTDDLYVLPYSNFWQLVIERSNVTLDGAGHSLNTNFDRGGWGNPGGVSVTGMSNVTIMNLTITGFTWCISLSSCLSITLTGNVLKPDWFTEPTGWMNPHILGGGPDIELNATSNSTIVENYVTLGIGLQNASNFNHIFHNSFQFLPTGSNDLLYYLNVSGNNFWDDGYPSGGNFWLPHTPPNDPNAVDVFSGPYQNETGSDGIVDTPLTLSGGNVDHYPLIVPRLPYALPPAARFHVWSSDPILGREAVNFDASMSTPGWNGTQVMLTKEYRWDFGDGNVTSLFPPFFTVYPIVFHAYWSPGTFKVTLTVIDREGMNSSTSQTVHVVMAAMVSISTTSPSSPVGYKVTISGRLCARWNESLKDEMIVLSYIFGGIKDWTPITSTTTDSLGNYQAVWIPTATGSFTLKASWSGNTTWLGATSSTTLSSIAYENQYIFAVESNSTKRELGFNATNRELSFTATGSNGTLGYARVTVPRDLVGSSKSIKAYLDGSPTTCGITSNDDSYVVALSYAHSTHSITVSLGSLATSFIDTLLGKLAIYGIPIMTLVAAITVYIVRRKRKNP
jgi:hypothetical protein